MKKPDASLTLLSLRSSPYLLVYDKTINDLYHVEMKSTKQVSSRCPGEPHWTEAGAYSGRSQFRWRPMPAITIVRLVHPA
jgi:hypothetical protein